MDTVHPKSTTGSRRWLRVLIPALLVVCLAAVGVTQLARKQAHAMWGTHDLDAIKAQVAVTQMERLAQDIRAQLSASDTDLSSLEALELDPPLSKDPWGNLLHYGLDPDCESHVFIASNGPDGQLNTNDDMRLCTPHR